MSTARPDKQQLPGTTADSEPRRLSSRFTALAGVVALAGGLTGCIEPEQPQALAGIDGVVIVSGAHANSPAPAFTPQTEARLTEALSAGLPVDMVFVSGKPTLDSDLKLKPVEGTKAGRQAIVKNNLGRIGRHLTNPPTNDGADLLEAAALASGQARSRGLRNPTLMVFDSGLSDRGYLDFTQPGMLGADPNDVTRVLKADQALPNLGGATVILSGIGFSSPPQAPLDAPLRAGLTRIWVAVFVASGATVIVDEAPRTTAAIETDHTVTPVPLPKSQPRPKVCRTTKVVFDSQSAASFKPNETRFVDARAAHKALDPIAEFLAADPQRSALIRGTTANDGSPKANLKRLGKRRADHVKGYLISQGARAAQITTRGVGSDFPEYVRPDRDRNGRLMPGPAALNRSIRITTTDHC